MLPQLNSEDNKLLSIAPSAAAATAAQPLPDAAAERLPE
jgi:hypothetical protein